MKKYFLLSVVLTCFLSSDARPNADQWVRCLFTSGYDCSGGAAGIAAVISCMVTYGDDPCGTKYYYPNSDGVLTEAKCCSQGLNSVQSDIDDYDVDFGDFKVFTAEDSYTLRGRDAYGFEFDIYDFSSTVGDHWVAAVVNWTLGADSILELKASESHNLAPYYIESTSVSSFGTYQEILNAYGLAVLGTQANKRDIKNRELNTQVEIIELDYNVDLLVKDNNWSDVKYSIGTSKDEVTLKYQVVSINGAIVHHGELNSKNGEIDLSSLRKGIYIFNFETNVGVIRKKYYKLQ